jgi:hypothetical protein
MNEKPKETRKTDFLFFLAFALCLTIKLKADECVGLEGQTGRNREQTSSNNNQRAKTEQ